MTNPVKLFALSAALVGMALAGGATASAKTTAVGSHAAAASSKAPTAPLSATAKPAGYTVVSAIFTAVNGGQSFGSVTCPATSHGVARYPLGGGVVINTNTLGADINASYPSGTSWYAYVNNSSGGDTTFGVYAVCGTVKSTYSVVSQGFNSGAGVQTGASVSCPTGRQILGGGSYSASTDLTTNINSSYPSSNGWHIDMNNGSALNSGFTVYAICAKVSSHATYTIVSGTTTVNPAFTQTGASASCPVGTLPTGGGGFSNSGSTAISMNSTYPLSNYWSVFEDNGTSADAAITAYAVCLS